MLTQARGRRYELSGLQKTCRATKRVLNDKRNPLTSLEFMVRNISRACLTLDDPIAAPPKRILTFSHSSVTPINQLSRR
jgi:hypothetical protein